jgi:hypothetical protein
MGLCILGGIVPSSAFEKKNEFIFLHGAGKYKNRIFHVPVRCANWLQGFFFYVG